MEIYELQKLPEELYDVVGGKARGLNMLSRCGLNIAKGFVVTKIEDDRDFTPVVDFKERFTRTPVAVRSSASGEDGAAFSSAGQYQTFLNVEGREQFVDALKGCVASLRSETATAYTQSFKSAKSGEMNVVVQEMVNARAAGVLFTVNPSTGKKEIVLEAVSGLGESLVSGQAAAENYVLPYDDEATVAVEFNGAVKEDEVKRLVADAVTASEYAGIPLDMEWAIDFDGTLYWLQARPVTTDEPIEIDELDGQVLSPDMVLTTCNIGEMLPGAVTPLSLETTVHGIDIGLHRMLVRAGAFRRVKDIYPGACVTSFSNHLFFNLTTIYKMATTIAGANKSDVEASICGKTLQTPPLPYKKRNIVVRAFNSIKYFSFLFGRKKAMKKAVQLNETLNIGLDEKDNALAVFKKIEEKMPLLVDSTWYHYNTSTHSGAMSSMVLRFIRESGMEETEARALLAEALEDIDDIESVDILRSLRQVAKSVKTVKPDAGVLSADELLAFIENADGEVKESYDYFIKRHGHRTIREAELRSKAWHDDKHALMENILTVINAPEIAPEQKKVLAPGEKPAYIEKIVATQKGMMKKGIVFMVNQARLGVYSREFTKAQYVRTIDAFKRAYRELSQKMVEEGFIPDEDLLYFFRRHELAELLENNNVGLVKKALKRRRLLPEQQEVRFNDVYIGRPKALIPDDFAGGEGAVLSGTPISRGLVKGKARVVKSVEDAKALQNGEIMIAGFTDIGWSPFYSVIGGLITEVGSALSHGAVVAREYGLPLVVNVKNATDIIKTGDLIEVNATKGSIVVIAAAEV